METEIDLAVIGGGAAGYFAALRAAEGGARVVIFEAGRRPLEKVRISGGGRCNVTHACFEPRKLIENYPRGSRELLGAFHRFQPRDTVEWFAGRGVELKTESDGRMFPVTDSSSTIIDCFEREREKLGVKLLINTRVTAVRKYAAGHFVVESTAGNFQAKNALLAGGSHKSGHSFAVGLGHSLMPLAPSIFTFEVPEPRLHHLSGVSVSAADLSLLIEGEKTFSATGPLLITHWGLSGPAVLRLSAFAARELAAVDYQARLRINFSGLKNEEQVRDVLLSVKNQDARHKIASQPLFSLPKRLWEFLLERALSEVAERPWNEISKAALAKLAQGIFAAEFEISGKGQFKEEFVTAGGVALNEIEMRTMESRIVPGLYFAGEILDIDGVTGGFNFQAAWTTAWIAASAVRGS